MSDSTHVTLTIPSSLAEKAKEIFDGGPADKYPDISQYNFENVNYGELDFLDKLQSAGIPFDSDWEQGDEYGKGCESLRFSEDGEAIRKTIYVSEINPDLHQLMAIVIDPSITDTMKLTVLVTHISKHNDRINCLPWDNQAVYAKTFLTRKLIGDTDDNASVG